MCEVSAVDIDVADKDQVVAAIADQDRLEVTSWIRVINKESSVGKLQIIPRYMSSNKTSKEQIVLN